MYRYIIVLLIAAILPLSTIAVASNNPANLANDFQYFPFNFLKATYDGGPWYVLGIAKIGDKNSVSFCHWESQDGEIVENQLILAQKITSDFQVAVNTESWQGADDRGDLVLNWSKGQKGLAILVPFQKDYQIKIGPRITTGKFSFFAIWEKNSRSLLGINFTQGASFDITHGQDITWIRISKPIGNVIPELRFKKTTSDRYIGIGIGFLIN